MRAIDEQYLKTPFYGRRRMTLEIVKVKENSIGIDEINSIDLHKNIFTPPSYL
ncbi:hypothetical protein NEPTK9_001487 [Candidatus Neptunochlamydia vexilliferae]|uniref:Uncharacterized protein n=1 Tax=Candidatus Neptunichlamydia vexilliferae TaxID=1651774 RepID=A0ABS0B0P3_9BACT|nr:hypothetical protein [Candidatus Neptunochlamydia vexilliferae]